MEGVAFFYSKLFENQGCGAEACEAGLEHVDACEDGQQQPIGAEKIPKSKAAQNDDCGETQDGFVEIHKRTHYSGFLVPQPQL